MSSTEGNAARKVDHTLKYICGPVALDFHRDKESRVKLLIGPFGTGKTSSAAYDQVMLQSKRVRKSADGVIRTRFAVVRNCYDDQTEILTEKRGWVYFRDLVPSDKVAVLHGDETLYEAPTYYYQAHYHGTMMGVQAQNIDLLVTPDHRVWTSVINGRTKERSPYRHESMSDAYGKTNRQFHMTAEWRLGETSFTEDFFEFLGFWFAEGYAGVYEYDCRVHYRLIVSQKKDIEYVEDLLNRAGFTYGKHDKGGGNFNFTISLNGEIKRLIEILSCCGKATTKKVPEWIKDAPIDHLKAFLFGYIKGDGHAKNSEHDVTRMWTSSKHLADDLQEIAFRAGLAAIVCKRTRKNRDEWAVTILTDHRSRPCPRNGWYEKEYDGIVYCVEVSTHIVYVRRNGKPVWCGQTFPQLRDTTIATFLDWFPPLFFGRYNSSEKRYLMRIDNREIEILFRALDIEKDVRNLLSLELTGAWVDEAREINQSIFKGLLGRIGRYPSVKDFDGVDPFLFPPQVLLTTNYPSREHWLYRDFVQTPVDGYKIYEQDQSENKHNLKKNYYENLEKDYANRPDLLKTLVRGEWGVTIRGKQVYPEFNRKFHVAKESLLPLVLEGLQTRPDAKIVRCWDNTGLSPAAAVTYLNSIGQWLVFKEFIGDDISIVDFGHWVNTWCGEQLPAKCAYRDIGDPAGKSRDTTKRSPKIYLAEECGIHVEDGIQTFKTRKEAVVGRLTRQIMGEPAILIDPSCIRLIDGFEGGYAYPEIGTSGYFASEPAKNEYSHIADAVQYGASKLFKVVKDDKNQKEFARIAALRAQQEKYRGNPVTGY